MATYAEEQSYLSLLIADIDCFKPFNDTYGHQAGDDCLRRVARVISDTICRPEDLVPAMGVRSLWRCYRKRA